jgi:hypothetical protein
MWAKRKFEENPDLYGFVALFALFGLLPLFIGLMFGSICGGQVGLKLGIIAFVFGCLAFLATRLQLNEQTWIDSVLNFGRWFHRAAGRSSSMAARAGRAGKRWFQGLGYCRLAFG